MKKFTLKTIQTADDIAAPILIEFNEKYGMIPNFFAALGIDGASLNGYLKFEESIKEFGSLSERQRELISLNVANYNQCHYCVSGHTFSAKRIGLTLEECSDAQRGIAEDSGEQAMLFLSRTILERKGNISQDDIELAFYNGLTENQIIQVCAWTALNTFSNWVNNITKPKIDFPKIDII
ncbi:carboxymuconolactone decarboxylase family protein [Vibrio parahaemolyticus]|uniref:carboxymuconolactone decarboxylase family protein n=1 Tax=Vibrio parahaemolyticus TaxID=670 RepID=UPI00235FDD55|nr:carboxymuconolactone decarboxylase family protein [Vibrio parahaemolyticus]